MISGTAGSTSFFLKKFCWETNRFSRYAWRVNDVVHRKTAGDRKDLQSCSKHSRMPMTLVTRRSVRGSAISFLSPFPQTKLTNGYAAVGNIEPDTSRTLHLKTAGVPSPEHSAGANQERDASFQAHDQCRRELCLGHPCGQVPSLEGDRILYACGGWMPPPPLVTLLPLVLARRRSDPLGRCPEPMYALRWPAPPQPGSLETSAESIQPFASPEPDPVYCDRSRPTRAGHCAAQHRPSTLPLPAPAQILRPALPGVRSACEPC